MFGQDTKPKKPELLKEPKDYVLNEIETKFWEFLSLLKDKELARYQEEFLDGIMNFRRLREKMIIDSYQDWKFHSKISNRSITKYFEDQFKMPKESKSKTKDSKKENYSGIEDSDVKPVKNFDFEKEIENFKKREGITLLGEISETRFCIH